MSSTNKLSAADKQQLEAVTARTRRRLQSSQPLAADDDPHHISTVLEEYFDSRPDLLADGKEI